MQMKKTLGILLAVCFLMSVTAAAVSASQGSQNPWAPHEQQIKVKANNDVFRLNIFKSNGNVLKNDKGKDLRVLWYTDAKKGKIFLNKKTGSFSYKLDKRYSREHVIVDSFKYTIIGKDRKTDSAKVTIIFENKKKFNPE
jgi:hypothetical protein